MERGEAPGTTSTEQPTAQDGRVQDPVQVGDRQTTKAATSPGLEFPRFFTLPGVDPFDEVAWEKRSAVIGNERGEVVFEQRDVEIPSFWSQQATNIVVSKYFRGLVGSPERESSVKQLIGRVVDTITAWGRKDGYFAAEADVESFSQELKHLLVYQKAAFNSPVWFNCGFEKSPQCSACFINSVQDTMESILTLARTEGMLFKYGSGTGSNLSAIRSSRENLAGGGTASGPVSFMKGYDAFAGVIKSGGKTRRAAKMVILNAEHPDIVEFINCKVEEEKKAWALHRRRLRRLVHRTRLFVGLFPEFQQQRARDRRVHARGAGRRDVVDQGGGQRPGDGQLQGARSDAPHRRGHVHLRRSRHAVRYDRQRVAHVPEHGAHQCVESVLEYMFLDDSACNLSSINLMKFVRPDGEFDVVAYRSAFRTLITAQEIIVDSASYPTPSIEKNSHAYRPLGLGYANLGALLMSRGLPYDSDGGRDYAASLTAIMTGEAYAQSARVPRDQGGPFRGYEANREPFLRVMRKHRDAVKDINARNVPAELYAGAKAAWDEAVRLGELYGYRNAQATVLAPTGTIGFMMDCDTTGVEPDIALVKYKKLVGGGLMKIVNQTVPMALAKLGYSEPQIKAIIEYIDQQETIEGAPELKAEHLPVFDCAFKARKGERSIHYLGHIKMMGATQPFISGAISKTVNVPKEATVEEIMEAYIESWRLGAKAISIYRDGSKRTQPLNTSKDKTQEEVEKVVASMGQPVRRRLPDERQSITHKFDIAGHEGYITVGLFEDGTPGELFLVMAKEGSTISGFADAFAQAISYALQFGVPLQVLVDKFSHARFEPSGMTKNPDVRFAKSIVDYIFRWLASKFLSNEAQYHAGVNNREERREKKREEERPIEAAPKAAPKPAAPATYVAASMQNQEDAPPCSMCGAIMVRSGSCYKCANCGSTSGCA